MGIPTFYKWLVERYPKCVVNAVEDRLVFVNGVRVPVDVTGPNPNGIEYDNLYLDMNGIIHPCFHPVGLPAPTTYDEVFEKMFKYIDKIFSIVRPRKLLFMAIDGVAPRAKMNQQRARRFKAAREAAEAAEGTTLESEEGKPASLEQPEMDSNVITPGTEFMELLSSALRYYIHLRMNEDSGWKGIKVILSDATVPGEGEYKVMSFIRLQRNLPGYDPNTWHCMYGLDADLIMLALATHEINFSILREDGPRNKQHRKSGRRLINQKRRSGDLEDIPKPSELLDSYILKLKFQFLNIWVLREYLRHDMEIPDQAVKGDLERFVDDFVFMCLFVGNDFLPQIPSLEISEGAINLLLMIYKDEFVKRGGYLTNSFEVNLKRVEHFLHSIGAFEKTIIRQRTRTKSKKGKRSSKSRKVRCNGSRFPSRTMGKENPSIRCTSSGRKFKLKFLNWKDRFYVEKFEPKTTSDCKRIKKDAAFKYVEGICWVMRYYYQEVCSWQWFYPYHYAPFASDFANIDQLEIQFTLGEPFKPFDQLLGVLPAARCTSSAHALPMAYRKLMTDSSSPILDFYPTDFEVDMEGKRFAWQAVIKLPFIDESRLLSEIAKVEHTLTDEDRKRNTPGLDVLFVHVSHPLAAEINSICEQAKDTSKLTDTVNKQKIDPALSGGMNGYIYISDKPMRPAEICSPIADLKMIAQNDVISVFYKYPAFHSHIPRLPDGVMLPEKIVGKDDLRPLYKIWCSKGAHLLYARKTQAIWNIIYSSRNKPMTYLGSYKQQVVQHNEAGYTLRRQLLVNRGTKEKANIVLNCHVKKLENCDLQKQRKGDGESIPEDALLRLKGKDKSSEGDQVPCEDNNGNCAVGLKETGREVKHGKVEGVSFSVENFEKYGGEQTDGGAANKTIDAVESKRRKPRSIRRKHSDDVTHSNGEKIGNFENIEQSNSDGNNGPVADGPEEKIVDIKDNELNGVLCNDRRSEGIDARKTEVGLHADSKNDELEYKNRGELERGQKNNEGGQPESVIKLEQTEVDKSKDGMDMETEVRSNKRKKQKSRKRKHSADIGQNNDENLKRFFVKEPIENDGGDGVHKDAFKMESSINREQPEEVALLAAPAGIGEVKTEVKSKKNRKRSRKKKDSNSEEQCTVGHNTGASGVVVLKGVKSSEEDQVPCEDNNSNCAAGLKEADREVKHGKVEGVSFSVENFEKYVGEQTYVGAANKTINIEIKHSELNGVLVNDSRSEGIDARKTEVGLHADIKNDEVDYKNHGELEMGQKKNEGSRPGSFIKWEQTEVDKSGDGVEMEMEMEVRSKKRKRQRSKKRKHSADIGQNNDENLKTFFVKEPVENDCGDGVQKDAFKMEGSINREQPEEVGLHAAPAGIGEVKTEVKSKKNRKRSKKRKDSNSEALSCNNDGELNSCSNREQCTVVGHNTGASGVVVLKGGVKSSEEDQVPCEDNNGNCAEGLKEADREVKHDKVEGVSFSVENFEKYVGEQTDVGAANKTINVEIKDSELNGVLVNDIRSEGIDARKPEVGLHADIKNDEVKYKSRGELEMGQKKNEGGRPGSFIKWEQTEVDKSRDGVEMETEVRSKKRKRQRSKKRKHIADIRQNNDENLKTFFVKEPVENDCGDGVHKDAFKMEGGINREQPEAVGLHAASAGIGEVKTEVKSKKNRKRSKKGKDSNSEALSCNNDGEFKSCSNREQCTVVGHNTGASGVVVLKGVKSSEEDQVPCEDNNGNCAEGLKEADREVKHDKVEGVSFSVENFEKYVGEQTDVGAVNKTINIEIKHSELNGVLVNDSRSEGIARKTEVGLHADIKNDEVEYKSRGELEMGQKKNEGGRPGSFIKWEQTEVDKSRDGVEMQTEVRSKKRRR